MPADVSKSNVLVLKGSSHAIAHFVFPDPAMYDKVRGKNSGSQDSCAEQVAKDLNRLSFTANVSVEDYTKIFHYLTVVGPDVTDEVLKLQRHYSQGDFDSNAYVGIIKQEYLRQMFNEPFNQQSDEFERHHYHTVLVSPASDLLSTTSPSSGYVSFALFVLPNRKDFCLVRSDDCFSEQRTLTLMMNADHPYLNGKESLQLEGVEQQWVSFSQAQMVLQEGLASSSLQPALRQLIRDDGQVDLFRLRLAMRRTFAHEYAGRPGDYCDFLQSIKQKNRMTGEANNADWRSNLRYLKKEYDFVGKWWQDFSTHILSHERLDPKQQRCYALIAETLANGLHGLMQRNLDGSAQIALNVVLENIQQQMKIQGLSKVDQWIDPNVVATLSAAFDPIATKLLEKMLGVMVVSVVLAQLDVSKVDDKVLNNFIDQLQQAHSDFAHQPEAKSAEQQFNDTTQHAANVASTQLESQYAKQLLNSLVVLLLLLSVVGIPVLIYQYARAKGPRLFGADTAKDILKQRLTDDLLECKHRVKSDPIIIH